MPLFRRFFVPKVHWSEGSLVRRFVNPNLGTSFSEKISAADHTQARGRHVQILIKLGIAVHIVFVIVIITMVHAIIDYVPIFRQPIGSTAHWSDSPLVRQPFLLMDNLFAQLQISKESCIMINGRRFFYCFYMKFLQWSISSSRMIYTTHNMQAYLYCSCEALPLLLGL